MDVVVVETPSEGVNVRQIAEWMVGSDVDGEGSKHIKPVTKIDEKDIIFETRNLWVDMPGEIIKDVSLKVRRGEILGIGGLAGQGKLGIPNGIMGLFAIRWGNFI